MKNKKVSGISFTGVDTMLSGGNNGNSNNPSPPIFDMADRESYLTNQSEINYARSQPSLSFEDIFHPIAFPPSPAVQKAGFSGIEIILLLGLAAAAGTIIAKMANEKKQIQRFEKPVKQSIKSLKLK